MNYLAHLMLSNGDEDILIGNFIADGLRSKEKEGLSEEVMNGVYLHYFIDEFTDSHPVFLRSKKRLFKKYGHYSSVLVDLFYDHFLAINWNKFSSIPFLDFTASCYEVLKRRNEELPYRSKRFLGYAIEYDVFTSYAEIEGMSRTLVHFSGRAGKGSKIEESPNDLIDLYDEFNNDFLEFFPDLLQASIEKLSALRED